MSRRMLVAVPNPGPPYGALRNIIYNGFSGDARPNDVYPDAHKPRSPFEELVAILKQIL